MNPEYLTYLKEVKDLLEKQLDSLEPREKQVLLKRFGFEGEEKTLRQIGLEMENLSNHKKLIGKKGISVGRVRTISERALRKLRHPYRSNGLRRVLIDIERGQI